MTNWKTGRSYLTRRVVAIIVRSVMQLTSQPSAFEAARRSSSPSDAGVSAQLDAALLGGRVVVSVVLVVVVLLALLVLITGGGALLG